MLLKLILATVVIVAALSFLLPWASKKMEEPFQGSEGFADNCPFMPDTATTPTTFAPTTVTDEFKAFVKAGQQKYNRLAAIIAPDDDPFAGAPGGLDEVNKDIESALVNVDFIPTSVRKALPPSVMEYIYDTGPQAARAPSAMIKGFRRTFTAPFDGPEYNVNAHAKYTSYVEERLPPRDPKYEEAQRCQNQYNNKPGGVGTSDRISLCESLDDDTFLETCGVCIKDAQPHNLKDKSVWGSIPFFGGLFVSAGDKRRAQKTPTIGSCAPGYFFVRGQANACLSAAQALNCKEYAETGGFTGGKTKEGISDNSRLQCAACPRGTRVNDKIPYVYYDMINTGAPTGTTLYKASPIRIRFAVPSGTGKTYIFITVRKNGNDTVSILNKDNPFIIDAGEQMEKIFDKDDPTLRLLNMIAPGDELNFYVYQEFPHRPRGNPEVFLLTNQGGYSRSQVEAVCKSIGCTLATKRQIVAAQRQGLQACDPGWGYESASISSGPLDPTKIIPYISRSRANIDHSSMDGCMLNAVVGVTVYKPSDVGSPAPAGAPAPSTRQTYGDEKFGIWCYGIKPTKNFLGPNTVKPPVVDTEISYFSPDVVNFFDYLKQTDEDTFTGNEKDSIFSQYGESNGAPNYRAIMVQFEMNTADDNLNQAELNRRKESAEPFLTKIENTEIRDKSMYERVNDFTGYYKRCGVYATSEQIAKPKPADSPNMINNAYWFWGKEHTSDEFVFSIVVPGYFRDPQVAADVRVCNAGPLIVNSDMLRMIAPSDCDKGVDDRDSTKCIEGIFKEVGGDLVRGTLSPRLSADNIKRIYYADYPTNTQARTIVQMRDFLTMYIRRAGKRSDDTTDRTVVYSSNNPATVLREMNEASQFMFGRDIVSPCERVVQKGNGDFVVTSQERPFTAQCLDFLYRRTTGGDTASIPGATYNNIGDRYSGINPDEIASDATRAQFPYQTCQPTGTWAPITGGNNVNTDAVKEINKRVDELCGNSCTETPNGPQRSIFKAIQAFQEIYTTANALGPSTNADAQMSALEKCYGVRKKIYASCNGLKTLGIYIIFPPSAASPDADKLEIKSNNTVIPTTNATRIDGNLHVNFSSETEITSVKYSIPAEIIIVVKSPTATGGDIAMKVARMGETVSFSLDDTLPLVPYGQIYNSLEIGANRLAGLGKVFRLESARFPGYFLTVAASGNSLALFTYESSGSAEQYAHSNIVLTESKSGPAAFKSGDTAIYSLTARGTSNYITHTNGALSYTTTTANSAWVLRPAINNFAGLITIESATMPQTYITVTDDKMVALQYGGASGIGLTDYQKVLTCWRIHPGTV
jgi:Extracellular link domain